MYSRSLQLKQAQPKSFFLWGARQVGKSSLLKATFPEAMRIDLLRSSEFVALQSNPSELRSRLLQKYPKGNTLVIIDEIQKVPQLLDEIHALIEDYGFVFALCGSSAVKLKRGGTNLLGGRAHRYQLFGLSAEELGPNFKLKKVLNRGYLPALYDENAWKESQRAYCEDYLKEEIAQEGLVRNLPSFSRFLEAAALGDTEIVSVASFARDVGVSSSAINGYFSILEDTYVGRFLPAYSKRPKRRITKAPKFYFSDVGIVNYLARRGELLQGSELWGKAFENWAHHELQVKREYSRSQKTLSHWRLTTGVEVDFIVGDMDLAIEVKAKSRIQSDDLKGLRELKKDFPKVQERWLLSQAKESRLTEDGIQILSVEDFIAKISEHKLWS